MHGPRDITAKNTLAISFWYAHQIDRVRSTISVAMLIRDNTLTGEKPHALHDLPNLQVNRNALQCSKMLQIAVSDRLYSKPRCGLYKP